MLNLFPCLVTGPDRVVYQTCRVVSGPDGTTVWAWDRELGDARPVLTSPSELTRNAPNSRHYTGLLDDGATFAVSKSSSCGCGHPMKRWRLPKPVRDAG